MDDEPVRLRPPGWALAVALAVGLAGLALLTQTVQNSDEFGRWHDTVLLVNTAAALLLLGLLAFNLLRLARDRRAGVPGSALKLRLLAAFAAVAAAPVLVVFLLSVQFLHRGIETWADERIAQGLERSWNSRAARSMPNCAARWSTPSGRRWRSPASRPGPWWRRCRSCAARPAPAR